MYAIGLNNGLHTYNVVKYDCVIISSTKNKNKKFFTLFLTPHLYLNHHVTAYVQAALFLVFTTIMVFVYSALS